MHRPFIALALLFASSAIAGDTPFELTCDDGFVLQGRYGIAEGTEHPAVARVVILLHGSGPQSMDVDLTSATKGQRENLVFRDISNALVEAGFATMRYNKRSYEIREKAQADPAYLQTEKYAAFGENPLLRFVEDARNAVALASTTFPNATIHLLGHSQGTYIALQLAHTEPAVQGVGLIGFYAVPMEFLLHEQTINRPFAYFRELDANSDGRLDDDELSVQTLVAGALRAQKAIVDLDGDGAISAAEYRAGNMTNLLIQDLGLASFTRQEATYPRVADILKDAPFAVVFLQGELDNQTPAFHAKAVELASKLVWKNDALRFHYFDGLGHALDRRTDFNDLEFDVIDPAALAKVVEVLDTTLPKSAIR